MKNEIINGMGTNDEGVVFRKKKFIT